MKFTNKQNKMTTNPKLLAIADTLSKLTASEAKELGTILEMDYGIKRVQSIVSTFEPGEPIPAEQTEFDAYLLEPGVQRLQVIKTVKQILNLSLIEAKNLVESAPCKLKGKISKDEAEALVAPLRDLMAKIEIK
jgi:large subunit ribosomal protein L7/L12